jgi:hypothetical protein
MSVQEIQDQISELPVTDRISLIKAIIESLEVESHITERDIRVLYQLYKQVTENLRIEPVPKIDPSNRAVQVFLETVDEWADVYTRLA